MKTYKAIVIISILIMCVSLVSVSAEPEVRKVKEELHKLLDELGMVKAPSRAESNPVAEFLYRIIGAVIDFIVFIFRAGSFLVVPIVLLLIFLVGYCGVRVFVHFRKDKGALPGVKNRNRSPGGTERADAYSLYLSRAEEYAENGKFGDALVQLHKASIAFLRIKKILLAGEYQTNNEIRRDLQQQRAYFEAFSNLAGIAERKTFRAEVVSEELYRKYLELFHTTFVL